MGFFTKTISDQDWLSSVQSSYQLARSLTGVLDRAIEADSIKGQIIATHDLLAKLPPISETIRGCQLPAPTSSEACQAKAHLESALKHYIDGSKKGAKLFRDLAGGLGERLKWGGLSSKAAALNAGSQKGIFEHMVKMGQKHMLEADKFFSLQMFATDSGIGGRDWVQRFASLNEEATRYADKFVLATSEIFDIWREIRLTEELLQNFKRNTYGNAGQLFKEKHGASLIKMGDEVEKNREILWEKRKKGLAEARVTLEKLPQILNAIKQLPELASESTNAARHLHQCGLEGAIQACQAYIEWCENDESMLGRLIEEARQKMLGYRLYCGRWEISGNVLSAETLDAFNQKRDFWLLTEITESFK